MYLNIGFIFHCPQKLNNWLYVKICLISDFSVRPTYHISKSIYNLLLTVKSTLSSLKQIPDAKNVWRQIEIWLWRNHAFIPFSIAINPLTNWEGRCVSPTPFALVFCPLLKISLRNPYLKILDLTKLYFILFYFLSEQFEIWVWKPPIC